MGRRPFAFVELDLDFCQKEYGTTNGAGTCTAAVGITGAQKCFKTRSTCQDPDNYSPAAKTYRFCENVAELPRDLEAYPFLGGVTITPTRLQIGQGIGERGSVTLTLSDAPSTDRGIDPYVSERDYTPFERGTFFGKFVARNSNYLGRPLRVFTGYLVGSPARYEAANFEQRLYFIEKMDPPGPDGTVTIVAKDILKLSSDDRAQAPRPAEGRLDAPITAVVSVPISVNLLPAGIGNSAYSAGGGEARVRINGEIFKFTRVGDALTLTARAQNNTEAAEHALDDAVQECYVQVGQRLQDIAYDLFVNYAGIAPGYIPKTEAWDVEEAAYLNRLYNCVITSPVGVNTLIGELCEQGPAYFWWNERTSQLVFRALRPATAAVTQLTDAGNFLADSVRAADRLDQRVSEVWVFFGQRDPTGQLDDESNYKAAVVEVGDSAGIHKQGQRAVKKIYARFLNEFSRVFASQVAVAYLQRFNEAPKQLAFALDPKDGDLWTGDLFVGATRLTQDETGAAKAITYQVLEAGESYGSDRNQYLALEERYSPHIDTGVRTVLLSVSNDGTGELGPVNLREVHDNQYTPPTAGDEIEFIIEEGVILGAPSLFYQFGNGTLTSPPGVEVGDWPAGVTLRLINRGRIQGAGGAGGTVNGDPGGDALRTRYPIEVDNTDGQIWAGGGGGAGASASVFQTGGGGAGYQPGQSLQTSFSTSQNGSPGTTEQGGPGGGSAGRGGDPGLAGQDTYGPPTGAGGPPGVAIDGVSYITFSGSGDIRGAQVN